MKQIFTIGLRELQNKLIDTSRRNKLINYKRPPKSRSLKIIDESAEFIFSYLVKKEGKFRFKYIPEPPIDINKYNNLKDERKKLKKILDGNLTLDKKTTIEEQIKKIESELTELEKSLLTPEERAKELGFNISNELPEIDFNSDSVDDKYTDNYLQTLHYPNEMEKILKNIERNYRSFIEETGTNMLYLILGVLEWRESDFSDIINKSPLVAIPITINKEKIGNHYSFTIEYSQEGLETNLSLAEKLLADFNIILPELNEEIEFNKYLKDVQKAINDKKSWKIKQEISLDFLHFGKILMYRDLKEENWDGKLFENQILKDIFIGKESSESISLFADEYEIDDNKIANEIPLVMDADSSQHSAIIDVIDGKNIVIEGPPGTGKSQTISNIIASLLAKGKTILFVSEKLAALEVVKKRLEDIGLGDFCLELHSNKSKKTEVLHSIEKRLNSNYESISDLEYTIKNIEYTKDKLSEYLDTIHKKFGKINKTIYNIFWLTELYREGEKYLKFNIENTQDYTNFELSNTIDELNKFKEFHINYRYDDFFWKGLDLYNLNFTDIDDFLLLLNELKDEYISLNKKINELQIEIENQCNEIEKIYNFFKSYRHSDYYNSKILKLLNKNYNTFLEYNTYYENFRNSIDKFEQTIKEFAKIYDYNIQTIECIEHIISLNEELSIEYNISNNNDLEQSKLFLKAFFLIEELGIEKYNKISNTLFNSNEIDSLLDKFKYELIKINIDRKNIEKICNINDVDKISIDEFDKIISIVENKKNSIFNFLSSEYKNNLNKIKKLLKDDLPKDKTEWSNIFNSIQKYIEKKEKIDNNERYILHFGDLFRGSKTNINDLEYIVEWIKNFKKLTKNKFTNNLFMQNNEKYKKIISYKNIIDKNILNFEKKYKDIENIYDLIYVQEHLDNKKSINFLDLKYLLENNNKKIKLLESLFEQEVNTNIFSNDFANSLLLNIDTIDFEKLSFSINKINFNFNDFKYQFNRFEKDVLNIIRILKDINNSFELNLTIKEKDYLNIKETLKLYHYIGSSNLTHNLKIKIFNDFNNINKLIEIGNRYQKIIYVKEKISKYGQLTDEFFNNPKSIIECINKLNIVNENRNNLSIWSDFRKITQSVKEKGLAKIVEYVENDKLPYDKIKSVFLFNFYNSLVKEIFKKYPLLVNFNRLSHEQVLKKFKELDRELIIKNRNVVASKASNRHIPYGYSSNRVSELTELVLINHEVSKKKRHIPIRRLVERASNALLALKPCFMMSPLSVSQYLPSNKIEFDVLIVDEASQLKPEEALGSIARVKQIVIVGDPKQLPPTSFFASINKEDGEESVASESESILDISLNLYKPIRQLRWHYRSQHESLIDFSNKQFYDNNLLIFPSPKSMNSDKFGIKHHYIENSIYENRRNKIEAVSLIKQLELQMKLHPNSSIGVGTFNSEQRDLLQDMIDEKEKTSPIISKFIAKWQNTSEPFFIKNLENIQGDERDVIFISTTYGKDKSTGKVYQRFGPINSDVGWRRLNVMFTRAKQKMEIFTSLSSNDIIVSEKSSRGVRALKAFLKYIETSKQAENTIITGKGFDSEFEESVFNLLKDIGYNAVPQVGVAGYYIDLAVTSTKNSNDFILAIECDGATYHSSKSARDRDRLKQEVLERLGWKVYRIWSVDWYKNRENEISKLIEAIKKAEADYNSEYEEKLTSKEEYNKNTSYDEELTIAKSNSLDNKEDFLSDDDIVNKLKNLRDNKIAKEFKIDKRCILSDLMIELFVKHKPLNMDEFREKIPLRYRNINVIDIEQMKFMPDIFEILEMAYE